MGQIVGFLLNCHEIDSLEDAITLVHSLEFRIDELGD